METDSSDNGHNHGNTRGKLHNRSAPDCAGKEKTRRKTSSPFAPRGATPRTVRFTYANRDTEDTELDRQIRNAGTNADTTSMRNRVRLINGAIVAGILALFVASFSAMNFFVIVFAQPETIAKVRYLKFGMSVFGSVCMFFNALCIFLLCVEMKYAITKYVKHPNDNGQ